jgi:hypothetical protein
MHVIVASLNAVWKQLIICFRKVGFAATHMLPEQAKDKDDVREQDWRKLSSEIDFSD